MNSDDRKKYHKNYYKKNKIKRKSKILLGYVDPDEVKITDVDIEKQKLDRFKSKIVEFVGIK